jgi:hypothetical protein
MGNRITAVVDAPLEKPVETPKENEEESGAVTTQTKKDVSPFLEDYQCVLVDRTTGKVICELSPKDVPNILRVMQEKYCRVLFRPQTLDLEKDAKSLPKCGQELISMYNSTQKMDLSPLGLLEKPFMLLCKVKDEKSFDASVMYDSSRHPWTATFDFQKYFSPKEGETKTGEGWLMEKFWPAAQKAHETKGYDMFQKTPVQRWRLDLKKTSGNSVIYCMVLYDVFEKKWKGYVGQAKSLFKRFHLPKKGLLKESHTSCIFHALEERKMPEKLISMQAVDICAATSYLITGKPCLLFVLDACSPQELDKQEGFHMKSLCTLDPSIGYNKKAAKHTTS